MVKITVEGTPSLISFSTLLLKRSKTNPGNRINIYTLIKIFFYLPMSYTDYSVYHAKLSEKLLTFRRELIVIKSLKPAYPYSDQKVEVHFPMDNVSTTPGDHGKYLNIRISEVAIGPVINSSVLKDIENEVRERFATIHFLVKLQPYV